MLYRAPLWVELGDAWRSWCNPAGEDTRNARFEMSFFEASTQGFLEGYGFELSDIERSSLGTAIERVTLELCSRYVTDALEEQPALEVKSARVTGASRSLEPNCQLPSLTGPDERF